MRLVLATNHLGYGGSESYLQTVAEQFDRLGHSVAIYSPEGGPAAALSAFPVLGEGELEPGFDASLVQDAGVSHQIADALPRVPQLFVAHSETFDLQSPPQLPDAVQVAVALNDRVASRLRSYALEVEVVRLRQPIDTERFISRSSLPEIPRRALLLSNTRHEDRIGMLEGACADAGVELVRIGGSQGQLSDVRSAIAGADFVIGYGRTILEAMASGRAAYVYDWNGGEGWVTPESYPAIEADGIAGRSGVRVLGRKALAEDFQLYSSSMGPQNHDLVIAHHRANQHAQFLIELLRDLAKPLPRDRSNLEEMARLVRLEWRARAEIHGLVQENTQLREQLRATEADAQELWTRLSEEVCQGEERVRRRYESSLSWRITNPLRKGNARVRRALRGD